MAKSNRLLILLLFFLIVSSKVAGQAPTIETLEKIAIADRKANENKLKGTKNHTGNNYDLKYHRFNWYINPDTLYIKGSVTSYFVTTQANVSQVSFELNSKLTVDSVIHNDSLASYNLNMTDELLINLDTTLPSGYLDSVTIYYQGVPDSGNGFGSFIKHYHDTLPMIPAIWTLSQPYGTKDWWPCKNDLSDKIDSIDVYVTTPQQYRAASNGLLVSETQQGADKIYHWKHRYPIAAYLVAIAVTNYAVYSNYVPMGNDSLEVLNYVFPEDTADAQWRTPGIIPVIQLYDSLFIPYPFMKEKYGHAQFARKGGMEHQTMSFMGNFEHELMAHELAHQWFGDYITCSNWHDIWLNEGFATYLTGLSYEYMFNGYFWNIWKNNQIGYITSKTWGSVYVADTTSVWRVFDGRLSYSKGAMLLHMLRWTMGDDNFFKAMNKYLTDTLLAFSYVTTENFKQHIENIHGKSLTEFFNDWFYGEGHPVYTIHCDYLPSGEMDITIEQTQSHPSVSYFEMRVPLYFKGNNQDTTIVFDNTYSGEIFRIHPEFKVDSVFFDPNRWLVAKLDTILMSVADVSIDNTLNIYPVPASDELHIYAGNINITHLELIDLSGKICEIKSDNKSGKTITLCTDTFKQGIYFLKVYTDDVVTVRKVVII